MESPPRNSSVAGSARLLLAAALAAGWAMLSPVRPAGAAARSVAAVFTGTPPAIDGDLSDPAWALAEPQSGFRRHGEPDPGAPALVETIFRVLYDARQLYIAVEMHGDDPDRLLAAITRRDEDLDQDDSVVVYIDACRDRRSTYCFQVNPRNTQRDLSATAHGAQLDVGWDAVWRSATARLADGWTAELAIPLAVMRFPWAEEMTWGFEVGRGSLQHRETSEWCYVEDSAGNYLDPRLFGELAGLRNVARPRLLQAIGSLVGSVDDRRRAGAGGEDGWDREEALDGGADLLWGVAPTVTLNATYRPDFAQIEADAEQLNLTGEELYLAERRPFFRENNALLKAQDGETPFYSRRIVDILEGLKLTGQLAGTDFATLIVRGEDAEEEENIFTVLRSQSPIGPRFVAGGWLLWKESRTDCRDFENDHGESYESIANDRNLLAGADCSYRPGDWQFNLHYYRTWYPGELRPWYVDRPTDDRDLLHLRAGSSGRLWTFRTHYIDIGDGYYPEMGFSDAARIGQRTLDQWLYLAKSYPLGNRLSYLTAYGEWTTAYERDDPSAQSKLGGVLELGLGTAAHFGATLSGEWMDDRSYARYADFQRDEQGQIINPTAAYFASTLGEGNHRIRLTRLDLHWTDGGWQGVWLDLWYGRHYYSRLQRATITGKWKASEPLALEAEVDYVDRDRPTATYRADHPDWTGSRAWVFTGKLNWALASRLRLRAILSGLLDDAGFDDHYGLSLLAAYDYRPASSVYLVYENEWQAADPLTGAQFGLDEIEARRATLYLKLTCMLDL